MDPVASFPSLSNAEFQTACTALVQSFKSLKTPSVTGAWMNIEVQPHHHHESFYRITRPLPSQSERPRCMHGSSVQKSEPDLPALEHDNDFSIQEEKDNEVLSTPNVPVALIHYDILLSPTYRVPTLYFSVSDPLHRYPPTMSTLYTHIISPEYVDQTKDIGVLGGITITEHPAENRPVFFVHPCRTAEVMEAVLGSRHVLPVEYLLMWIGAIGKCVGLDVPLEIGLQVRELCKQR